VHSQGPQQCQGMKGYRLRSDKGTASFEASLVCRMPCTALCQQVQKAAVYVPWWLIVP
jgi:hypothetical protein